MASVKNLAMALISRELTTTYKAVTEGFSPVPTLEIFNVNYR